MNPDTHDPHDHIAKWIEESYGPAITTTGVNTRVDEVIADFEEFRAHVGLRIRQITVLAGVALAVALAAGVELVVVR